MAETAAPPRPAQVEADPGYDEDFVLWTERQAALIRAGRLELVDWENVAEEIESLGTSDRRELCHRLEVLMMHLLKWQFQPMHRSRSWQSTIRVQRGRIERLLKQSPSLRRKVADLSREEYAAARDGASGETGFALRTFPKSLPYTPNRSWTKASFPDRSTSDDPGLEPPHRRPDSGRPACDPRRRYGVRRARRELSQACSMRSTTARSATSPAATRAAPR